MADLRIFSYLPNPRIWIATIAARLCGVEFEIRNARHSGLYGEDAYAASRIDSFLAVSLIFARVSP